MGLAVLLEVCDLGIAVVEAGWAGDVEGSLSVRGDLGLVLVEASLESLGEVGSTAGGGCCTGSWSSGSAREGDVALCRASDEGDAGCFCDGDGGSDDDDGLGELHVCGWLIEAWKVVDVGLLVIEESESL